MTFKTLAAIAIALLSISCRGTAGKDGETGPAGPQGPLGPEAMPPRIDAVYPPMISDASIIQVVGAGFATTGGRAYVNGVEATITSATATEIWAQVTGTGGATETADVTVFNGNSVSNTVTIEVGQRNDSVFFDFEGPTIPTSIVYDDEGKMLYLADFELGVFRLELESGNLTQIVGDALDDAFSLSGLTMGPDDKLYYGHFDFGSFAGRIERLEADGSKTLIANWPLFGLPPDFAIPVPTKLAWSPQGVMFVATVDLFEIFGFGGLVPPSLYRLNADGTFEFIDYFGDIPVGLDWADGTLHSVSSDGEVRRWDLTVPTYSTVTFLPGNSFGGTSDGVNLFVVTDDQSGSILRVAPDGTTQTVVSANSLIPNMDSALQSTIARAKSGEFYFSAGSQIVRADPSGITRTLWKHPNSMQHVASVGGTVYFGDRASCFTGVPSRLMKATLDGQVTPFVDDVCVAGLDVYNGQLILADDRGEIVSIDPSTGARTLISDSPFIAGIESFTVDANGDVYVGQYDFATDTGKVTKITADGQTVNPLFVNSLPETPISLHADGTNLYVQQSTELLRVAIGGGAPTVVIAADMGFEEIYAVNPGRGSSIMFSDDYWGTFSINENADVGYETTDSTNTMYVDPFNNLVYAGFGVSGRLP